MTDIIIKNVDEVYVKLQCNKGLIRELSDEFTFFAANYKFHPKFKKGLWDGKIRLLNYATGQIYKGLVPRIVEILEERDISYEIEDGVLNLDFNLSTKDVYRLYEAIQAPYEPKDYQVEAVKTAINNNRCIILSPTASGKSYFLYGLARFYQKLGKRVLIVLHRKSLVKQLAQDNFCEEYDKNRGSFGISQIYGGADRYSRKQIVVSTWQSIYKLDEVWFTGINPKTGRNVMMDGKPWKGFDVVLADEVHAWTAAACRGIMEKCRNIKYRIGTSGTLDDIQASTFLLEGCFGPVTRVAETTELMDRGDVANLDIKGLVLNYPKESREFIGTANKTNDGKPAPLDYINELRFIYESRRRMKFLTDLSANLEGNILIAFKHKSHGKDIYDSLKTENKFFVDGDVDVDIRSDHSKAMDKSTGMTGVVSLGTFAEGINIKNVNHVILACPLKSKIKLLQMIGRGLRLSETKSSVIFWDICDEAKYKKRPNCAMIHFAERMKQYQAEGFNIELREFEL